MDHIKEIYSVKGDIITEIKRCIIKKRSGSPTPTANQLVELWFCDSIGAVSEDKIIKFLLSENPAEYIHAYYEKISELLFGDVRWTNVLEYWPRIKEKALSERDRVTRKNIITSIIKTENLFMFDNITATQLLSSPDLKTIYSQKKLIEKINFKHQDEIQKIIEDFADIFDYDALAPKFRSQLLSVMKVTVCPYCNRQYITNFSNNGKQRVTADIDHFYAKDLYPFLSLSLYNFIPSCQICNSRFKGTKDFYLFPHVYPYDQEFGTKAKFELLDFDSLLNITNFNLSPVFQLHENVACEEIHNSIETFQLNNVYKSHTDYVREIIAKAKIYSDEQLREYLANFDGLFRDKEEMLGILYGSYLGKEDAGRRPLSKLTQDILDDLGVDIK